MPQGWIRAYAQERAQFGFADRDHAERDARARFREGFSTTLHAAADDQSPSLAQLGWGAVVDLPQGLSDGPMTAASVDGHDGFLRTDHVVEVAYVRRRGARARDLKARLEYESRGETQRVDLLWGDCVQIVARGPVDSEVRARGFFGQMRNSDLTPDALLEVYFIDVGQGDGVLVRTPDARHLLVDGGLERKKQLTGKSAADFVDWKFFRDYGDFRVRLDSMTASHSDNDHYGGLQDLVRTTAVADRELDCVGVDIDVLHHPGLSRWEARPQAVPAHADGLGPKADGHFVRLLGDRADAEGAIVNGAADELSRDWKALFRDVLGNDANTRVERVGVPRSSLPAGGPLPAFWPAAGGCSIRVLGPVTIDTPTGPALPDLGSRSINTNGHSICLRIDYGRARILLTGDLNKPSMDHLRESFGDRMGAFACDVAKACHHGSDDISYQFLEAMRPAATVISSGDAEGHAHPRPEIVGASAVTGFVTVSREDDRLLTPLVYMTEVERSVSLGAVNRIDFAGLPVEGAVVAGTLPGRQLDELTRDARMIPSERAQVDAAAPADRAAVRSAFLDRLGDLETAALAGDIQATYSVTEPQGPLSARHRQKPVWRSRVMTKNHYGLVNVRTDGDLILCATLDETEDDWIIHSFPARFPEV